MEKEKGKINLITLIILLGVILLLGLILGYVFGKNTEKDQEKVASQNDGKAISQLGEMLNEANTVTQNYEGSKSIEVNGKKYIISYISEKFKNSDTTSTETTELKVYLNDIKVATIDLGVIVDVYQTYGSEGYSVELYNICDDYIAILIKTKYANSKEVEGVDHAHICVINTEGQHINTFNWDNITSVVDKDNSKALTYKIEKDGITLYETYSNFYNGKEEDKAIEYKYSIVRDHLVKKQIKTYNVWLAGK